ncbi:putative Kinase-like domain-containing protein [Seiridium cardinale]
MTSSQTPQSKSEAAEVLLKLASQGTMVDGTTLCVRDYYKHCPLTGYRPRWSMVFRVPTPEPTIVKTGPYVTPSEVENMALIRTKTTIPVPEVYDCWEDPESGWWCIWMSCVEGVLLTDQYEFLNDAEKSHLASQLRGYLAQTQMMRKHRGPIAAADGKPSCDQMLQQHQRTYATEETFREHIIDGFLDRAGEAEQEEGVKEDGDAEINAIAREIHDLTPEQPDSLTFTHGNFTPRNIVIQPTTVDEGGPQVVGVLDWSQAGYYPAYWEYVKMSCCEQVEIVMKATGQLRPAEPGFLRDEMPDHLLEDHFPVEAQAFRRAYRKVWGHSDDL